MKPVCLPLLLVLLCVAVPAAAVDPVHASFTANQTEGSAPLTVSFLDTSTGGPTSWMWDFGDGGSSTERNPIHTFVSEGAYSVTLIAERAEPHSADSKTLNIYVRIGDEVVTDFTATPCSGLAPLAVQFTDLSINATSWSWEFGDGGSSAERNPVHTYAVPGNYTVSLMASNDFRYDTETKIGYVSATGPVTASFTATPRAVPVGGPVQFTDTSTGNPFTHAWDFGDRTTSSEQNPAHLYDRAGIYNVSLTAANPLDTDSRHENGYVTVYDLVHASFTANRTFGPAPLTVQFNDTSTGAPTLWNWTFGDGDTSTGQNPVHTYHNPGTYDVTLTASNGYYQETTTALGYIVTVWVGQVPTGAGPPTDTNADGLCDDVNGNGRADFNDVVLYFNQMTWIAGAEPIAFFDYNGNGRIDFADVVWLFNNIDASSVRTFTVTAVAIGPGAIVPSGNVTVPEGGNVTFSLESRGVLPTPYATHNGYVVGNYILVDPTVSPTPLPTEREGPYGFTPSYTLHDVRSDHTVYGCFYYNHIWA